MPVIYCLVAHGRLPLAEYSRAQGNFTKIAHQLLEKIPSYNNQKTYDAGKYAFHCIVCNEIIFLCLADEEQSSQAPFIYLKQAKDKYESLFGEGGKKATAKYCYNEKFSPVLKKYMDVSAENSSRRREQEQFSEVQRNINVAKDSMSENMSRMLDRGDKLDQLESDTQHLSASAKDFKRSSRKLKQKLRCDDVKTKLIGVGVCMVIMLLLSMGFCGGMTFPSCRSDDATMLSEGGGAIDRAGAGVEASSPNTDVSSIPNGGGTSPDGSTVQGGGTLPQTSRSGGR